MATSYYENMDAMVCKDADKQKHTLIINSSDSRCGNCHRGASTEQRTHDTVYEYGPRTGEPGCGTEFRYVASDYVNLGSMVGFGDGTTKALFAHNYPDLEWNGYDELAMRAEAQRIWDERNA